MAQTCLGCSGGLGPVSLPLFQGCRWLCSWVDTIVIDILSSLSFQGNENARTCGPSCEKRPVSGAERKKPASRFDSAKSLLTQAVQKRLLLLLCGAFLSLDDLSRRVFRFVDFCGSCGLIGRLVPF